VNSLFVLRVLREELLGFEVGDEERILDTCYIVILSLCTVLKVNYESYAKKSGSKIKFC